MSVDAGAHMVMLRNVRDFTVESAEFIAIEVAGGATVAELHECHGELVPSVLVVNRWRRKYPAFESLMREAEEAKAEVLAEGIVKIADDPELQSAQARNAIDARKWLAGRLHEKYGKDVVAPVTGPGVSVNLVVSDEQLMQIAAGGLPALEGDSERILEQAASVVETPVVEDTHEPEAVR